jgi:hypothetical protein
MPIGGQHLLIIYCLENRQNPGSRIVFSTRGETQEGVGMSLDAANTSVRATCGAKLERAAPALVPTLGAFHPGYG